jgi:hypothetical protein
MFIVPVLVFIISVLMFITFRFIVTLRRLVVSNLVSNLKLTFWF